MNPIDQLMQSFGASPSSAIAGLLGMGQTQGTGQSPFAGQFAQALQHIEQASTVPGVQMPETLDLTSDQAELLASLQLSLSPEAMPTQAQMNPFFRLTVAAAAPTAAAPLEMGLVPPQGEMPSQALQQLPETPAANGAFAPVLAALAARPESADIPMLPQAALEKLGLKLEQLPALPSSEELAAVSQGGVSTTSHMLPATAAQGLFGIAAENTPVLQLRQDGTAVEVVPPVLAKGIAAGMPAPEITQPQPASQPAATDLPLDEPRLPGQVPPAQTAGPQVMPVPDQQVVEQGQAAQAAQAVQAAQATQATTGAQAKDVEGNGVVTQQAQQQVAAAAAPQAAAAPAKPLDRNGLPTSKPTASAKDAPDLKVGGAPVAAVESLKEAVTAKPVEPVAAQPTTQQPVPVREATPPLTPERLSGFLDSTSAQAVAAGLSGLKGETGFMASMSLLGGRPTPELAHQVSQQLNMHVTKAFQNGQQDFTVRLDPAELGRVRIKLSFLDGGRVHAQVMAERPETLDLMQRDMRGLEKAMEAAGHKATGGIQFSLDTNDEQSAGRAFAEAVQQEKMRDDLAARSGMGQGSFAGPDEGLVEEEVPLEAILANVSVETGVDIEV